MKFIPLKIKRKGFQKLKNKRKIFFVLFLFQRIYFSKFQKCDLLWYVSGTRYYIINHSVIFEYAPIIYYVEHKLKESTMLSPILKKVCRKISSY